MPRPDPTRSTLLVVVAGALVVLVVVPLVVMVRTVLHDSVGGGVSLSSVLTRPGLGNWQLLKPQVLDAVQPGSAHQVLPQHFPPA